MTEEEGLRQRIEKFCVCGGESYTEAPSFEKMSNKDIENWKKGGGIIMVLCKVCSREKITPESVNYLLNKTIAEIKEMINKCPCQVVRDKLGYCSNCKNIFKVLKALDSKRRVGE